MTRIHRALLIFTAIFLSHSIPGNASLPVVRDTSFSARQDTIPWSQLLYIGRAWRDLLYYIKGDPYLFSAEFIPGTVTINGRIFTNVRLAYDIYADELLTISHRNMIIQLNKEMVDGFSLKYGGQDFLFIKAEGVSDIGPGGYVNSLYDGKSHLIVKYRKIIEPRAIENKYDSFYQKHRIYIGIDSAWTAVLNRRQLLESLGDRKQEVKAFIRSNRIRVSVKEPSSLTPVIRYFDEIRNR